MTVADVISSVFLLTGSAFCLVAAIGLQRFDDVFARMHAATKAVTLGLLLICVGAAIHVPTAGDRTKLLLVAGLQLITAPVGAHMLGRAAYRSGTELSPDTVLDELGEAEAAAGIEPGSPSGSRADEG